MTKYVDIDPWKLVYRRVKKTDFIKVSLSTDTWLLKPEALQPYKEGTGISLFIAQRTTPYRVLKHHLDTWIHERDNGDDAKREKAEGILQRDKSVENMLTLGWRVVVLPLSYFRKKPFTGADKISHDPFDYGHISVNGPPDAFRKVSLTVLELQDYYIVPASDCTDTTTNA